MNPIVIDPPNFNQDSAWRECSDYVDSCGGLVHEDGEPNWKAAFGADPGVCGCPACHTNYWAWGRRQRCAKCGFEYPVDAWPQYSYGVQDALRVAAKPQNEIQERMAEYARRRASKETHPYYRYGFERPVEGDIYAEFHTIDWRTAMTKGEK